MKSGKIMCSHPGMRDLVWTAPEDMPVRWWIDLVDAAKEFNENCAAAAAGYWLDEWVDGKEVLGYPDMLIEEVRDVINEGFPAIIKWLAPELTVRRINEAI